MSNHDLPSRRPFQWSACARARTRSTSFLILALLAAGPLGETGQGKDYAINHQRFTVPDGFEVELVAGTNLVSRPLSATFDDQGRLYVTDSSGSNDAPQKQLVNPTHRILRLEDRDGDGLFDTQAVFADKVMFPQGCLWYSNAVYVAGPPSIWKFQDSNGDGVSDSPQEWFKGGTLTGCANDIHGPYLGPDGYIYWTKGAFAEQTHTLGNQRILKDRAAHIYRARPDGTDLDVIMSGGMDNPVEVAFTAEGEPVFTSTFIDFSQPGFRDGIGHAVYGGVFGKVNDVLNDGQVIRTGPDLLHPFYQGGPSAECGLMRYQGVAGGLNDYRNNLFSTSFNLHKVTRHQLRLQGAGYAAISSDFLVSDSQDFHPTDVLEDADGSLLVVDTGGWYKLCCPSSQLAKPEVLGAIYRVRRIGSPRLSAADRKANYLCLTQPPGMETDSLPGMLKKKAWKNDTAEVSGFREILLRHAGSAVTNAVSATSVRLAAEGLGRLKDATSVPAILEAIRVGPGEDPNYSHALIYSLIQIAAPEATRIGLKSRSGAVQRAALIALDQMEAGALSSTQVLPLLAQADGALREAAIWIFQRHPDWSRVGAGFAAQLLQESGTAITSREERLRLLTLLAAAPEVQAKIAHAMPTLLPTGQADLLETVAGAHPGTFSPEWIRVVSNSLAQADNRIITAAVLAARDLMGDAKKPRPEAATLSPLLLAVAENPARPIELRMESLLAIPGRLDRIQPELLEKILESLDARQSPALRAQALQVLQRSTLTSPGLETVAEALPRISPLELLRLLPLFEQQPGEALGRKLVSGLRQSKAARSLPFSQVKSLLGRFPATVQTEASAFLESLGAGVASQAAHLETLEKELKTFTGDIVRGQAVFNSPKASCTACHKLGYLGGSLGPDLTSIGQARSERDLLEAIVYPSASFVRSFEPVMVSTKSGEDFSGVLRRDTPTELVVGTGPNTEIRIARSDIVELRPGMVSVMPQGLEEQLTRQELADLLSFLKNTRWGVR